MSSSALVRKTKVPPPRPETEGFSFVVKHKHEDAVPFCNEIVGQDYTNILNFVWDTWKFCATVYTKHDGEDRIAAAAWGRLYDANDEFDGEWGGKGVYVGPIVALNEFFARVVVCDIIHQASERFFKDQGGALEATVIATNVSGSHDAAHVFGKLGFIEYQRLNFMVLQDEQRTLGVDDDGDAPKLDFMCSQLNRYFGLKT